MSQINNKSDVYTKTFIMIDYDDLLIVHVILSFTEKNNSHEKRTNQPQKKYSRGHERTGKKTKSLPSISMYLGLGSAQHDKKKAAKTSGYWTVAVIRGKTLSWPDKCPEFSTDRKVKAPAAADRNQNRRRMAEVTKPDFFPVYCK